MELVQINPNSWSGIKERLEKEAGGRTLVVCGQVHKLARPELEAASEAARGIGGDLRAAPAVITAENGDGRHRSAGTLVAVAKHVGSELLCEFGKPDLSPAEAPGRLSARWVNLLGGLAVFSLYRPDGVGRNETNRALAHHLLVVVKALGCPWIVSMEGNMTPSEFLDNGSVQCMRGVMAAPKEGTCRFRDQWKCYDYFLIDERLQDLVVEVKALVGAEARKPSRAAAPAPQHVMRELTPGLPEWQQCELCLRVGQGDAEIEVLLKTPCAEHPALRQALDKLGPFAISSGHHLWATGPVMCCRRCGCSTKLCVRKLAVRCAGAANAKWVLANLKAGRAGDLPIGTPVRLLVVRWILLFRGVPQAGLREAREQPESLARAPLVEGVIVAGADAA
jgi:hypothetical protein